MLIHLSQYSAPLHTGVYSISRNSETFKHKIATTKELEQIKETVIKVASDFGIIPDEKDISRSEGLITFGKRPDLKTKYDNIVGADSRLSISLGLRPKAITILIRDLDNRFETDFMKLLKSSLENVLSKIMDINGVEFKRFDPLT